MEFVCYTLIHRKKSITNETTMEGDTNMITMIAALVNLLVLAIKFDVFMAKLALIF